MSNDMQRPDWVVLGCPTADGKVAVFASKDLDQAELETETEAIREYYSGQWLRNLPTRTTLTVELRTYVIATGDTYEEAMRRLFAHWTPEPDGRPAIAGRPAIEQSDAEVAR